MAALRLASLLSLLLLLAVASTSAGVAAATFVGVGNDWGVAVLGGRSGDGGLGAATPLVCEEEECGGGLIEDEEEEMGMESESTRRALQAASRYRHISYAALDKNRVPCNRRGQSYYNCRRLKKANPYRRGCSIITRCARILN